MSPTCHGLGEEQQARSVPLTKPESPTKFPEHYVNPCSDEFTTFLGGWIPFQV